MFKTMCGVKLIERVSSDVLRGMVVLIVTNEHISVNSPVVSSTSVEAIIHKYVKS